MARIPLQSLVSARQSGIAVQPGVFQQTADATAGLLSSVAGGVEMVKQQFDRAQDIHNQSEISEKRRMFRDAQGEFQNRMLEKDFHPSEWGPEWIKTLEEVERDVDFKDMAPVVQRALLEDFENFAGSSLIEISGSALKENLRRGKDNFQRDLQYNDERGFFDANRELVRNATGKEISQEEADDFDKGIDMTERNFKITTSRKADPVTHKENLPQMGLSEYEMIRELELTDRDISQLGDENLKFIDDLVKAGVISNEADLIVNLEGGDGISGELAKQYLQSYQNTLKPLSDEEFQDLEDAIDALEDLKDQPAKYAKEYYDVKKLMTSYGSRPNRPDISLYNRRPEVAAKDVGSKGGARTDVKADVREIIREYSTGFTTGGIKKNKEAVGEVGVDYIKDASGKFVEVVITAEDVSAAEQRNSQLEMDYKAKGVVIRSAMQREANKYMKSLMGVDQVVDVMKVEAYIKKNSAVWVKKALADMREELSMAPAFNPSGFPTLLPQQGSLEDRAAFKAYNSWVTPTPTSE
tara:strand:+ start:9556 stop:11130 length:1575 start_codon:yes stop_codon:yes gene_type:complete